MVPQGWTDEPGCASVPPMTEGIKTQHAGSQPAPKRVLVVVFATLFLDLVGFGIIIPIQPFYAEAFGASPTVVTLLGATYSVMQFVFAPFWGRLSDRYGRRRIVLVSIFLGGLGYLLFGLAGSLPALFFARALAGFGNANIGTVQAIVADVTTAENRTRGMGLIGAAFGLGFILGPALGGVFSRFGLAAPAFVAAGLALFNFVLAARLLPETNPALVGDAFKPREPGSISTHRRGLSWATLRAAIQRPQAGKLLLLFFVITTGFALMEQTVALFIEWVWVPEARTLDPGSPVRDEALKRAAALTTWMLVLVGVVATIVQGGLIGRLSRRFGEKKLMVAGLGIQALGMASISLSGSLKSYPALLFAAVLLAIGSGLTSPSLSSLLSQTASEADQGGTLGLGQSLSALGRALGPAVAGMIFEIHIGLPFQVAAGMMLLCLLVALLVGAPTPKPNPLEVAGEK
jgi:multidrug resistance protein